LPVLQGTAPTYKPDVANCKCFVANSPRYISTTKQKIQGKSDKVITNIKGDVYSERQGISEDGKIMLFQQRQPTFLSIQISRKTSCKD